MVGPVDISELKTVEDYDDLEAWLDDLRARTKHGSEWEDSMRWLCEHDLYFLHRYVLNIGTVAHQPTGIPVLRNQLYIDMARATEYHVKAGKGLMASARRCGKSEHRTCALPIQMMLKYPDISISIFSGEKYLAHRHLLRVKHELEKNTLLKLLYEDRLWMDPGEEAKARGITWSKADGFVIRGRTMNRSTSTIEVNAMGGGPGSGYDMIIFDDIEWQKYVATQDAVDQLDNQFSAAISLMTPVVLPVPISIINNTRFSEIGLIHRKATEWKTEDERLVFEVPAEIVEEEYEWCEKYCWNDDIGPMGGRVTWPFTAEYLNQKFTTMTQPGEYALQHALTFRNMGLQSLDHNKIHFYDEVPAEKARDMTTYIGIDPSKGVHDPCAMWVWGVTEDHRFVWLDAKIGKFDITSQRFHDELFGLVMKWNNLSQRVVEVRVEDVANSDWAALVERELRGRGSWVQVTKVLVRANIAERKFKTGKHDRIFAHWAPELNKGNIWFPTPVSKGGKGILCDMNNDGSLKDLVDYFLNVEMKPFPAGRHDDGLDAGGMMFDEKTNQDNPIVWPSPRVDDRYSRIQGSYGRRTSWMSAG